MSSSPEPRDPHEVARRLRKAAEGLFEDLAEVGLGPEVVSKRATAREDYARAVPVYVEWLSRTADAPLRRVLIGLLSERQSDRSVFDALLVELEADRSAREDTRWELGHALAQSATRECLEDLMRVVTTPSFGEARQMALIGLARHKDERVGGIVLDALHDADLRLQGYAIKAAGMLRLSAARDRVAEFVDHEDPLYRRTARSVLKRL